MSSPNIVRINSGPIPGPSTQPQPHLNAGSSHDHPRVVRSSSGPLINVGSSHAHPDILLRSSPPLVLNLGSSNPHVGVVHISSGPGPILNEATAHNQLPSSPSQVTASSTEGDETETSTTTAEENESDQERHQSQTTVEDNSRPLPPDPNAIVRGRRRPHARRRHRATIQHPVVVQVQPPPQDPAQIQQGQGEQQANPAPEMAEIAAINPQPPPPQLIQEDPFDGELRVIKDVVDYLLVPITRSSINLVLMAWYFVSFHHNFFGQKNVDAGAMSMIISMAVLALIMSLLGIKAVAEVVTRPDLRIAGPFHAFEIRIAQLMAASTLCVILDTIMNPLGLGLGVLHFNTHDPKEFYSQLEEVRNMSISDFLLNPLIWFHVNLHFLIVSFAILFVIDMLSMFYRMAKRNVTMREILAYECYAYFYPVGYILSTFFILNCFAYFVPMAYQSFWHFWIPLNTIALAWIALVVTGVMVYPEIPLRRPMGLPGYMYMEQVTLTQIGIGGSLHGIIILVRGIYFQLVPGSRMEALLAPGIIVGSSNYFSQILGDKGTGEPLTYPFPFTYEVIHGVYFIVFVIRYVKLRLEFEAIQERIEQDIHAINNNDMDGI